VEVTVDQDIRRFREARAREGGGQHRRYPTRTQQHALAYWQRREAEGAWVAQVAQELGHRPRTLARWVKRPAKPASFRRVTVADARTDRPAALVVVLLDAADANRFPSVLL
jgi:transposase-like protein